MADILKTIDTLPAEKRRVLEDKLVKEGHKYGVFPLSFAQQRLWFLNQFEQNGAVYNLPSAFRFIGPLDLNALEQSVREIVQRHEILRTVFTVVDTKAFQVVIKDVPLRIFFEDLQSLPQDEQKKRIRSLVNKEASMPFNLKEAPLFRIKVLKTANNEHIILLTMHHIISDGWSMGIFEREIAAIYGQIIKGKKLSLPPLKIQYADFAKWQMKYLQGEVLEKQINYWKKQLGDIPPPLALPFDKARPQHQSYAGRHISFELSKETSTALRKLSLENETTMFMTMLAALQAFLSRYTGQDDITVGTPIAGRNRAETENLIGFFVNTLVLRTQLSDGLSFKALLQRVKNITLDAYAHQDLPYEKLIDVLQPNRNLSAPPLFQVFFSYQNIPVQQIDLSDIKIEPLKAESDSVKFDLTVSLEEVNDQIRGAMGFNTDLFTAQTIERLIRHFTNFTANLAGNPDQEVSKVPLLDEQEKKRILADWNRTEKSYDTASSIHHLIERQAAQTPERIALEVLSADLAKGLAETYTYAQLNQQANQLARYLIKKYAQREKVVGVCMQRSAEMIISLLAILKAGLAYLPIEPGYPDERIAYMLQDAKVELVLTQQTLQQRFEAYDSETLVWEALQENITIEPKTDPQLSVPPESLAYMIYTSGSTGRPKGVMVQHTNLVNYILYARELFELGINDRVLQFASISFDAAAEEIYPTLSCGATLLLRNDAMISSIPTFLQTVSEHGVSVLDLPTAYWHQLVGEATQQELALPDTLRLIIIGGERAIPDRIYNWQKKYGTQVRLLNTYGPTETTVVATAWALPQNGKDIGFEREVPIGRPVANARAYVLDVHLNPVPVGVPGELHIGGAGVARGYLNQPALSAQKFIPNPFIAGDRLYKTGDLVRFLADGNIAFLGRIDHQVKIRGFRIELGEIESILRRHKDIKDVALLAREDTPGDRRLVAYYTVKKGIAVSTAELRAFLKETLPDYMIPSVFMELDVLPISATGKINYRALPEPLMDRSTLEKTYVPPETPVEKFLTQLWQDVLGIDRIGIEDNFFELGGDSLKAAILINRIQQELDEILYVVVLFDNQNIRQLADYLTDEYPAKMREKFGIETKSASSVRQTAKLSPEKIAEARAVLSHKTANRAQEKTFLSGLGKRLPGAVFILSAPRSGSTLLRVMLAGNSKLFSPPEMALLNFRTMSERAAEFAGRDSGWMEGLHRAVMEIKGCDFEEAKKIIAVFEKKEYSTQQMYAQLQSWLDGKIIVDKTTTYATNPDFLQRAEAYFENAFYIHLTRHPSAMIQSYIDSNLDQVFGHQLPFSIREKAELFWIINNSNVRQFFGKIPEERRFAIQYEQLVQHPRQIMEELCQRLHIPFDDNMLQPYEGNKMRDGVHEESRMVGDPRFNTHRRIDPNLAKKWQKLPPDDALYPETVTLAERLGYTVAPEDRFAVSYKPVPVPRDIPLPLSFAQQRLWFLDQMERGSPLYNIPSAIHLQGRLNITALQKSLNTIIERHENLRTAIQTVEGEPRLKIYDEVNLQISLTDLSHLPEEERESEVHRLSLEEAGRPFALDTAPLLRASLLKLKDDDYIFLLTIHHIVSDGWSTGVLVREIVTLYTAFVQNQPAQLPPLKLQYADFAFWQRNWLSGKVLEEQIEFWRKTLEDAPPFLNLPVDHPRPPEMTYNGARISFDVDKEVSEAIKKLTRQEGASLFMTLLAVYQILLYRYSGQNDILVGMPIAGRNREEIEPLIGFFVNTLVIRTDFSGNPDFKELLKRVRKTALEAFAHQDLPFEKLLDTLNIKRDVSRPPLFQTMFVLQNIPRSKVELPGLTLSQIAPDNPTSKFEITLEMAETHDGRLTGIIEYNTDLYEPPTIKRMIRHFRKLLSTIAQNPTLRVDRYTLLDEKEIKHIIKNFNDIPAVNYPQNTLLHKLFEQQAVKTPQAEAVNYLGHSISYRRLNAQANQLAHHLLKLGVKKENVVAVLMERSSQMIIAIMGILKAGGAYLPLDPSYPDERLNYMLEDAGVNIICTQKTLLPLVENKGLIPVCLDDASSPLEQESTENPGLELSPLNLAYLIYTSGSTGRPKGVMLQHRSALNLAENLHHTVYKRLGSNTQRISLNAPIPFDASVQQIVMLTRGHALYIIPQEARTDGVALLNFLRKNKIDVLDCVPSQLKILLSAGLLDEGENVPKAILPGGEAIDESTWQTLVSAPATEFYNMYGPTECTVDSTIFRIKDYAEKPTIGRPIANVRFYVLDPFQQPVPIGTPGELYIAGAGLARGYLNRPDLTAEKFLPDPFSGERGARMYASGDLVRWLEEGVLEFLGRVDHQVKVRGFRMELGEIEAVLREHDAVDDAVVAAHSDDGGEKRLVAYLTGQQDKIPGIRTLRSFLSEKLPDYMIPATFVHLESFPLLPNGKVNRKALPRPEFSRSGLESEYVEPVSENEIILAEIWKQVLGIEKVGIRDNFFELGGDSILSIQVIARARQHGLQITPLQIFKHQTIAELATVAAAAPIIEAEQGEVSGPVPLTPIQKRFFEKQYPNPHHWNQSLMLEVKEKLEARILQQVVARLMEHHDALRLRYKQADGHWYQENASVDIEAPFEFVDLSTLPQHEQKKTISEKAAAFQRSLNLNDGPIARIVYFRMGDGLYDRLLMIIHHLAVDGISWRIFMEDFQMLYQQLAQSKEAQLPPKTTSFKQWAEKLAGYIDDEKLLGEKDYWLDIAAREITPLPVDTPGGKNDEYNIGAATQSLSEEETKTLLQDVPPVYNTQINDILLTALVRAFSRWTGKRSLLIHLEGHGREQLFDTADISRTMGWFTTLYPVHLDLGASVQPGEAIKTVKEQLRQIPNKGIGFGLLRYLSEDESLQQKLKALDEAQIIFNYLGQFDQALPENSPFAPAGEDKGRDRDPACIRDSLIDISGSIAGNQLHIRFAFSRNLFKEETVTELAGYYIEELRTLIEHCQNPEAGGHTASDFELAKLDNKKLDKVMAQLGKKKKRKK